MSSFVKRRGAINIQGTRASLYSAQPIASSGNPSLDHIFGGGFPIGSVIAIEEDKFGNYSRVLTKYFLAEGLANGHATVLASLEEDPEQLMHKLPTPIGESKEPAKANEAVPEEMRIAFRYNKLSVVDLEQKSATALGHHFDLSKLIEPAELAKHDITYWSQTNDATQDIANPAKFHNTQYAALLAAIHHKASQPQFDPSSPDEGNKNLLRICLSSIGSPLWYDRNFSQDLLRFLSLLRAIVRNTLSICLITFPMHLFHSLPQTVAPSLPPLLTNLVDYSFSLESFAGQTDKEANPTFKEYHGLLNIVKLEPLNSLAAYTPETRDLAFKLRRRKFVIEKLHLPPEFGDGDGSESNLVPTMSCSGGGVKSKLDF